MIITHYQIHNFPRPSFAAHSPWKPTTNKQNGFLTVKESLRQASHGVVAEVNMFERDVACCEDLRRQQLPPNVLLTELLQVGFGQESPSQKCHLYVISEGQDREVSGEDNVVAVDPSRVLLVEAAKAIHRDRRAELNARNLERAGRRQHWQGTKGRQQE